MVYIYELDQDLCIIIRTIFAVKISRKFAKNWWISLDQLLWSTEVNFCLEFMFLGLREHSSQSIIQKISTSAKHRLYRTYKIAYDFEVF